MEINLVIPVFVDSITFESNIFHNICIVNKKFVCLTQESGLITVDGAVSPDRGKLMSALNL